MRRKKRYDIEALSIDRVLNKKPFYRKYEPKVIPRSLFNFGK